MNPIYVLDRKFWDLDKLRAEARTVKEHALEMPIYDGDKRMGIVTALPATPAYEPPELINLRDSFIEVYPYDWGEITPVYMWINTVYPWHVDNKPNAQWAKHKGSGRLPHCAINIILEGGAAPVEFEGYKETTYEAALLNTSVPHRVTPLTERVLGRLSFKDKTFEEVVKGLKEWQGKNI